VNPLRSVPCAVVLSAVFALLAGCGSGIVVVVPVGPVVPPEVNSCKTKVAPLPGPTPTASYAGPTITVKVMSGNTPVRGASVQLYAAGNGGNGSAPTSLFSSTTTTDATGTITIPARYNCPFNLSLLYVVARGIQLSPSGPTYAGAVMMSTLGACNSISGSPTFVVNEATTVASAYALAPFLSPNASVGASATNFSGLSLAAGTVANLVNVSTGTLPGPNFPATGTAPSPILNALANALNACIASGGSTCAQLYSAATVNGSVPSNTLDAVLNIARHPASNVAAVFTASTASTAYAPAISPAPSDWTMFATFSGGGLDAPSGIGLDSAGNIRVASYFNTASFFTNTGVPSISAGITGSGLRNSYGLAVDQNDNSWIPNEQSPSSVNGGIGSMTVLSPAGQSVAGPSGYSAGGLNYPVAVSIDSGGISWIVDYGNSHLTLLTNSGTPLSGTTGYTTNQFAFPVAIGVDSKCYGFVANQSSNTITRVAADGSDFQSFVTGSGASGIAVDASDNVWVANYYDDSVGLLSSTGKIVSSGYKGGGIVHPQGIAVDGAGNVWVANYRGPSISELAGASSTVPGALLSPAAGFGPDAKLLEAFALAIDAGGNIWVSNFGSNTITEFVGMASPVRTPMLGPVAQP